MFDPRWTGSTTHGGSTLHFPGSVPSEYGNSTHSVIYLVRWLK
jgi:hypothetical protein